MTTTRSATAPAAAFQPPRAPAGPIVLATTGADGTAAIDVAARLAERAGTSVVVVSAVEPAVPPTAGLAGPMAWTPDSGPFIAMQRARVVRQLREAIGASVDWPVDVVVDAPAHAIAEAARARRASLVVMGLGRHDLAARLLGTEVTLRAIRRAPVPVLAVPDAPFPVPPRTAVVGVDFSASSVRAAQAALDLLAEGGTLHLVHVWERMGIDYPELVARDDGYERALPERLAAVERVLRGRGRDVAIRTTSLVGHAAAQLATFARVHGADLVAAGARGHGFVERLLVGRVTTALVRAAPCALLVTPEPRGVERAEVELALVGTTESRDRDEWEALLDAFSRRNAGRRTALEVDDPDVGAQAQETGYTLLGATYDRHDGRVALMLGDATGRAYHLVRLIDGATAIAIRDDESGRDVALSVHRADGQTLLTFLPERGDAP